MEVGLWFVLGLGFVGEVLGFLFFESDGALLEVLDEDSWSEVSAAARLE